MRRFVLAGVVALLVSGVAEAGPRDRRGLGPREPRFPRAAAAVRVVLLPYPYSSLDPPTGAGRRPVLDAVPVVASSALSVVSLALDVNALGYISPWIPPAIRGARVLLFGAPIPSWPPRDTAIWVATPFALRAVHWLRDRRNGGAPFVPFRLR